MTDERVLLLRPDAYYADSPGGVLVRTHQGSVTLTGASVGQWLDRLAPFLDGRHTLAELTASLAEDRRRRVEEIIATLLDVGAVRLLPPSSTDPGDPAAAAAAPAGGDLDAGYVDWFRPEGRAAVDRYRAGTVLVLGDGPLVTAVAAAAARTGAGVVAAAEPSTAAELDRTLDGAVAVAHVVADGPGPAATLVEQACAARGLPLAQAWLGPDAVWTGPVGPPVPGRPGWSDGWSRLAGLRGAAAGPGPSAGADPVAVGLAAAQLVHALFRAATGAGPAPAAALTRLDLATLAVEDHRLLAAPFGRAAAGEPAPQAGPEAGFLRRLDALRRAGRLDPAEFSQRAATLMDVRAGVFGEISEGAFSQLPLHVARAVVADPAALLPPGAPLPVVTGWARDFAATRYATALRALATYGSLAVDPRRLLTADGRPLAPASAGPAELRAVLAALRDGSVTAHALAADLASGAAVAVPAATAFPALAGPGVPYRAPLGAAAGYDWAGAVEVGLLAHCARITAAAPGPVRAPVDLAALAGDDTAAYCLAMLAAARVAVEVVEVTGALGVPVFAGRLDGATASYGCAVTPLAAAREALLLALLRWQSSSTGEPDYAPDAVPELPPPAAGPAPAPLDAAAHDPAPLDVPALVAALARAGHRALAVPLDHDPVVHAAVPFAVHVVVTP